MIKHPKINEIVIHLINQDKHMKMYQEDIEFMQKGFYRNNSTA
jgi:hypothetical protein